MEETKYGLSESDSKEVLEFALEFAEEILKMSRDLTEAYRSINALTDRLTFIQGITTGQQEKIEALERRIKMLEADW